MIHRERHKVIWWLRERCGKSEEVHSVMKSDLGCERSSMRAKPSRRCHADRADEPAAGLTLATDLPSRHFGRHWGPMPGAPTRDSRWLRDADHRLACRVRPRQKRRKNMMLYP